MEKIRHLQEHEIKLIAAGEVIERPASVVKELLENSFDAGATSLTIKIKDGGRELIEITDDGCGMSAADAARACQLHTTSKFKLASTGDLEITHYGFRGEALAAISAVSTLSLLTRERDAHEATFVHIKAGEQSDLISRAGSYGTTISVQDLFLSLPARRKFLKARETEWNAISQVIMAHAAANPSLRFDVMHDERTLYQFPKAQTFEKRVLHMLSSSAQAHAASCAYDDGYVRIEGVITTHEYGHYDRSQIICLINGRPVKHYKLTQALIKGYQGSLPSQRYPAAYISLFVDPLHVDVNVHPRKEEVAFIHPKKVEQAIFNAVTQTLEKEMRKYVHVAQQTSFLPEKNADSSKTFSQSFSSQEIQKEDLSFYLPEHLRKEDARLSFVREVKDEASLMLTKTIKGEEMMKKKEENLSHARENLYEDIKRPADFFISSYVSSTQVGVCEPEKNSQGVQAVAFPNALNREKPYVEKIVDKKPRFMGILAKTYILLEHENHLVLIDQHALHERILYEKLRLQKKSLQGNYLMVPLIMTLDHVLANALEKHEKFLEEVGIQIEILDRGLLAVRAFPVELLKTGVEEIIKEIACILYEDEKTEKVHEKIMHEVYAMMACKGAIKAGDLLQDEHVQELLEQMERYECVSVCPHGRPTSYVLKQNEIERLFKRKG